MKQLSNAQKQHYLEQGYCKIPGLVSIEWLTELNQVTAQFVEESRDVSQSNRRFDLEADHSASAPRLRRLNSPVDLHETYWRFASEGPFADIAEDLLGAHVKFHHSKLNFKWGAAVRRLSGIKTFSFGPTRIMTY